MDQRDEFSKWISRVEEALNGELLANPMDTAPSMNEQCGCGQCGCGQWECQVCFPETPGGHPHNGHDCEQPTLSFEDDMGSPNVPEEDPIDEEESEFIEKGRSGKGVKLGDIVSKTEFRKSGGENSPLTYGDDNLDEEPGDVMGIDQTGVDQMDETDYDSHEADMRSHFNQGNDGYENADDNSQLINSIMSMQNMGLSKDSEHHDEHDLNMLTNSAIKSIYDRVMGDVAEDFGGVNSPAPAEQFAGPTSTIGPNESDNEISMSPMIARSPSDEMRELMNRVNASNAASSDPLDNLADKIADKIVASFTQGQVTPDPVANATDLGESSFKFKFKASLLEQLTWDDEIFELLSETEQLEESSLSRLVGKNPGSKNLIQWLHKRHKLGNDADIVPAKMNSKRLLWKSFKSNPDQFIVVICQNGVAGIKPDEAFIKRRTEEFLKKNKEYNPGGDSTLPYEVVAFKDDGTEIDPRLLQAKSEPGDAPAGTDPRVIKARMGLHTGREFQNPDNIFNLIADKLGPIQSVYLTGDAPENDPEKEQPTFKGGIERDKLNTRAGRIEKTMPEEQSIDMIVQKISPVLSKLADQALGNIQRTSQKYSSEGNFDAAQAIAGNGQKLKQFMASLDAKSPAVVGAIKSAAQQASGDAEGDDYIQWLNDAAKGNSTALKPILDTLRSKLASLT